MAKVKYFGAFNPKAVARALKSNSRFYCQVAEDGSIYVCNGVLLFKMAQYDYMNTVQPVACCEAGNWKIVDGQKRDEQTDLEQIFASAVKRTASNEKSQRCPLTYTDATKKKRVLVPFHNGSSKVVSYFDSILIDSFSEYADFNIVSPSAHAIVYVSQDPVGLICPVRIADNLKESIDAAVKAYFEHAEQQEESA